MNRILTAAVESPAEVATVPLSYLDRDLSHLRFLERVLEEAEDAETPLLDRAKFLAIFWSNLDSFAATRGHACSADAARRVVVETVALRLATRAHLFWRRVLARSFASRGLHVVEHESLHVAERRQVDEHFHDVLRPLIGIHPIDAVCPAAGASPVVEGAAVVVRSQSGGQQLVVVSLPETLSALVSFRPAATRVGVTPPIHWGDHAYTWTDAVVDARLASLFPGHTVESAHRFRVVRQVQTPLPVGPVIDAVEHVRHVIKTRKTNPVVAFIVDRRMPAFMRRQLARAVGASAERVYPVSAVEGAKRYWEVSRIARPDLHHRPVRGHAAESPRRDLFAEVRRGDILLHHPFDAFDPVVDLIRQAAEDPDVRALSITLYRTDRESLVGHSLLEALKRRKRVRVVVELQARLDEERNIRWARELEQAGAQVSYGHPALKIHAKVALIVRHEGAGLRRYVHISSGNYHAFNAKTYTDLALLTCDDRIAADVEALFDLMSDGAPVAAFRSILVAPMSLRETLNALIDRETAWARRGARARILLKMNALLDRDVIRRLYLASLAGVQVDLVVRGMCALRPGVPGQSDRITVRSVVGRFLEHSRVWYFDNGGDADAYIGSADVRPRNLDRRIEVMVPLADRALVERLRGEVLEPYLADNTKARLLTADGTYMQVPRAVGESPFDAQRHLLSLAERGRS
jgi:polyphosphate kinase